MTISNLEATAAAMDAMRVGGQKPVDFDGYMKTRESDTALVKPVSAYRAELIDAFYGDKHLAGVDLPWFKVHDLWRIRRQEVSMWTGFNGHGKSMCLNNVALALMEQGEKVCILSFEMPVYATLARLARQAIGVTKPTVLYIDKFLDAFAGKLMVYDQTGDVTPERVTGVIAYAAEKQGCTQFIVDSVMRVIADEDDFNGAKKFVGKMCQLAKDLNVHIHIVHHSRKKEDETKRPGKQDSKGSGSLVDQVDNFVAVFRIPLKKEPDPTAPTHALYLDKQRHSEWEGTLGLWFDKGTLQFRESARDKTRRWVE